MFANATKKNSARSAIILVFTGISVCAASSPSSEGQYILAPLTIRNPIGLSVYIALRYRGSLAFVRLSPQDEAAKSKHDGPVITGPPTQIPSTEYISRTCVERYVDTHGHIIERHFNGMGQLTHKEIDGTSVAIGGNELPIPLPMTSHEIEDSRGFLDCIPHPDGRQAVQINAPAEQAHIPEVIYFGVAVITIVGILLAFYKVKLGYAPYHIGHNPLYQGKQNARVEIVFNIPKSKDNPDLRQHLFILTNHALVLLFAEAKTIPTTPEATKAIDAELEKNREKYEIPKLDYHFVKFFIPFEEPPKSTGDPGTRIGLRRGQSTPYPARNSPPARLHFRPQRIRQNNSHVLDGARRYREELRHHRS
jgi:hypothetical protein